MASLAVLTLKEAIIPIVPSFNPEDLRTVKIENKWTTTAGDQYAKMYLPICSDPSQKEVFLYVVNQFIDAAHSERLHLTVATTRYMKFRAVLDGDLRLTWQALTDSRTTKTMDSFHEDLRALIATYLPPSSYEDQLEYMRTATKPFSMSCAALGSRIRVISELGKYLPGARVGTANRKLFESEDALKRAFFLLMPSAWRVKFAESGQVLDGAYSYHDLIRFMSIQELVSKKNSSSTNEGGKRRAGRGRGYGGGRGRGRTNTGGYRPPYRPPYQGYNSYGSYGGRGGGPSYGGGSSYGSYSNPVGTRTPMGRFGGRGNSTPRQVTGSGSPGRGSYYGRGRTSTAPQIPNFYAEHYMADGGHGGQSSHAHASNAPEEHYLSEEQFYAHGQDQYYYGDQAQGVETSDQGNGDMYHVEEEEEKQASEDAHWLDEFGF